MGDSGNPRKPFNPLHVYAYSKHEVLRPNGPRAASYFSLKEVGHPAVHLLKGNFRSFIEEDRELANCALSHAVIHSQGSDRCRASDIQHLGVVWRRQYRANRCSSRNEDVLRPRDCVNQTDPALPKAVANYRPIQEQLSSLPDSWQQ